MHLSVLLVKFDSIHRMSNILYIRMTLTGYEGTALHCGISLEEKWATCWLGTWIRETDESDVGIVGSCGDSSLASSGNLTPLIDIGIRTVC